VLGCSTNNHGIEDYRLVSENEEVIVKVRIYEVIKNRIDICVRKFFELFGQMAKKSVGVNAWGFDVRA